MPARQARCGCWIGLPPPRTPHPSPRPHLLARAAPDPRRRTRHQRTLANINRKLGRITQVTLAGPAGTVTQTTPLQPEQKAIYQALSLQPPARVTTFNLT
jgi:hypothetical protein